MSHRGSISFENGHKKCDSTALTTYFYIVRAELSLQISSFLFIFVPVSLV